MSPSIMENQMDKKVGNDMEPDIFCAFIRIMWCSATNS